MALSFIPFAFPGVPGVRCAFQTRNWGVSEGPYGGGNIAYTVGDDPLRVSANRLDLAASLEVAEIAELDQIHGDTLVFDPPPSPLERFVEPPAFPKGDGLATDKPGIGLIIKTADCQPVLVAHKEGRHIAAFHIAGAATACVSSNPASRPSAGATASTPAIWLAVRGPSLGPQRSEFVNYGKEWGPDFANWFNARDKTMNLWQLTRDQLLEAGPAGPKASSASICAQRPCRTASSPTAGTGSAGVRPTSSG